MPRQYRVYQQGDKLTPKQERWIDEYIITNDYTTASRNAGYGGNSDNLRTIGYQNSLKFKDIIETRRKELTSEIKSTSIATLEDIFEFWTKMYNDPTVSNRDKLKASELLAKAKGGFVEKVEVKQVETDWFVEDSK